MHIASTFWRTKLNFLPDELNLPGSRHYYGMSQRYIRCIAVDDSLPVFPEKHYVWTHVFPGFTCSLGPFITSSSGPTQSVRNMRLLLQSTGTLLLKETPNDLLNYFNKGIYEKNFALLGLYSIREQISFTVFPVQREKYHWDPSLNSIICKFPSIEDKNSVKICP